MAVTCPVDLDTIRERFDCFRGSSQERTARKYGVVGVNVYTVKPP